MLAPLQLRGNGRPSSAISHTAIRHVTCRPFSLRCAPRSRWRARRRAHARAHDQRSKTSFAAFSNGAGEERADRRASQPGARPISRVLSQVTTARPTTWPALGVAGALDAERPTVKSRARRTSAPHRKRLRVSMLLKISCRSTIDQNSSRAPAIPPPTHAECISDLRGFGRLQTRTHARLCRARLCVQAPRRPSERPTDGNETCTTPRSARSPALAAAARCARQVTGRAKF